MWSVVFLRFMRVARISLCASSFIFFMGGEVLYILGCQNVYRGINHSFMVESWLRF